MPKKFPGLGRGLGALISTPTPSPKSTFEQKSDKIIYIDPNLIDKNPYQPRKEFDEDEIQELAESIKRYGILQPLVVSSLKNGRYELIAGERRLRAAKFLNLKQVPVIIREVSELEKLELSLIENIQRSNLNPIELALAYKRLIDEFELTQELLAQKIGKSRSSIANTLRYLTLPPEIQNSLASGEITESHAKLILSIPKERQINLWKKIVSNKLTIRKTQSLIEKDVVVKIKPKDKTLEYQQEYLEEILGTKVRIFKKKQGGKIEIDFYDDTQLAEIIRKISGKSD